jgi:diguanylate cyclase (GGDEF)-like protein
MKRAPSLLSSAIGRRLLSLFVVAAFVPIIAMMIVAFTRVSGALEDALQVELTQAAKSYGLELFDRLVGLDDLLGRAASDVALPNWPAPQEAERLARDFDAVAILSTDGTVIAQSGSLPGGWQISRAVIADLARGKSLLTRTSDAPFAPVLLRRVRDAAGVPRIAAAVPNLREFWGNAGVFPAMTDFCVASAAGAVMQCSRPIGRSTVAWAQSARDGAALLRWEEDEQTGEEALWASTWTLFVESRFTGEDWVVLAMQPESYALRATNSFRAAFIPVALLALLIVLFVSTNQLRRVLVPLQRLLTGTLRVADNDFGTRIEVASRDEFGRLARAFNDMANRLGSQFRTLTGLADIDRAILTTLDLGSVATAAARCIRDLSGSAVVSVALADPGAHNRLRVCATCAGDRDLDDRREFEWDPAASRAVPPLQWTAAPDLPAPFVEMLRSLGACQFALLPVVRENAGGVVVLGDRAAQPIAADRAAQIASVVDRLAIALAAAARDKQLHDLAHFDSLTGLPNRYYLLSLVGQALANARRDPGVVAVLFVDLDNFKRTNDTLGHAAGDRLLQVAAARIRTAVREGDIVARWGGDEFTVVLPQLDSPQAAGVVAQKLVHVLSDGFDVGGQATYAGASIGIAAFPSDGATAEDLLKKADTALYRAKARGRGSFAFFEEQMDAEARERARVDRELRLALQRGELVLHFQPQLDLRAGRLSGAEALVRWDHPQRGLLGPASFIHVAEESGLIEAIGSWVLDQSCDQLARWQAAGLDLAQISVNVSPVQLRRPDFLARVKRALARNGLPPCALVLEVTESLFTDAAAVLLLRRLQEAGVRIAVDDFGTGYSSFAYLRTLPISILKIDRTFIVDVATSSGAATIAAAIIGMAQALGKLVVAEGVETAAQIAFLERSGCEHVQGFAVSRPVAAEAFAAFARDYRFDRTSLTHKAAAAAAAATTGQALKIR